jgi:predicted nucleic acid-binding Zn ribbon protein
MPHSTGWRRRKDERSGDATPLGDVVQGLMREPLFARGVAVGKLASEWSSVVGPRLASETTPASLEGGTLVVVASTGAWGTQARFLAREICRQANAALGSKAVRTVRVVVRPDPPKTL